MAKYTSLCSLSLNFFFFGLFVLVYTSLLLATLHVDIAGPKSKEDFLC